MFDCFLAQVLILMLIFFCDMRFFIIKKARVDSFAAFAPIALIISICTLACFGFSLLNLALFLLSLLVFFTNFRAVIRLSDKLIVDSYSVSFMISSTLSLAITLALTAFLIYVMPVQYTLKEFSTTKKQYSLTGPLSNLRIKENMFSGEKTTGELFLYQPDTQDEISLELYSENPVLLFVPGIRANVKNYEPYFLLLAQKGFTVLSADLYSNELKFLSNDSENPLAKVLLDSKFFRRFYANHLEKVNPEKATKIFEDEKTFSTKKYSMLTKLALEILGDDTKIFYITDGVDFDSIYAVIDEYNTAPYSNAKGFYSLNRVSEYKSSGYGFIEQTDVLLARSKGLGRENKFFIPRYAANKTIESIREQVK
ncbi:MAG: hypothetical protein IJ727_06585 [Treponema sp.]|nr:hypothetical protein [Treponema sp.]